MTARPGAAIALAVVVCGATACIPTAARKNAKLTDGFDVDFVGAAQVMFSGIDENGDSTDQFTTVHGEIDVEWATTWDNRAGLALQLKLPITIVFATLDLYVQIPTSGRTYLGFGAELSGVPGGYMALTRYLSDTLFVTLTPRLLVTADRSVGFNPQFTLGTDRPGASQLSLFVGYAQHLTGRGIDVDVELFSEQERNDFRKRFLMVGVSARY